MFERKFYNNIIVCIICTVVFILIAILMFALKKESIEADIPYTDYYNFGYTTPINNEVTCDDTAKDICVSDVSTSEKIVDKESQITEPTFACTEMILNPTMQAPLVVTNDVSYLADTLGVTYTVLQSNGRISEEELIYVATIIQLEVMGDGSELYDFDDSKLKYWEMLAVAQCIRNRVKDNKFPNDVSSVIFASHKVGQRTVYQFSSAEVLKKYTPTDEAIEAARDVFQNGITVIPENYFYFCATKIEDRFEKINASCFVMTANNTYEKIRGHLTTFYAGKRG